MPTRLPVFSFFPGFVLGQPIPLSSYPQQGLALKSILGFAGMTPTFVGALSIVVRC